MLFINQSYLAFKLDYYFIFVFITKVKLICIINAILSGSDRLFLDISIT